MPRSSEFFAEGPGYYLRVLEPEDISAIAAFSADETYWRFLSHGPRDREQVETFVMNAIAVSQDEHGVERWWAVIDPETDRLIGTANIKWLGPVEDRFCSAGCALAPAAQGKRLGVTLGKALIKIAFDHFKANKIECTCAEDNERSFYMMNERVGLTYDGVRRTETDYQGRAWPVHVFSLNVSEFRSRQ